MRVALHDVAHSRAGDKGNLITLSLVPYDAAWYDVLREAVQAEDVRRHLSDRVVGDVVRYELPLLPALSFLCARRTTDSVTTSLNLDGHGKTLSSALLELQIDVPAELAAQTASITDHSTGEE